MGLTWQDVAGQVRSSDFSGSANMITKGLDQLSGALQAPERLRQEQLDREMRGLMLQSDMNVQTGNMLDRMDTKKKGEAKERDMKEFGAAQSTLEALSRNTAMKGGSYEDVLKSEAYQSLSEGARAYGASNLSDAFMRGDETRIQRADNAADDARNERHFQANYQLSKENAAMARQDRRDRQEDARAQRELANYGKPKVWRTGNDKTDKTMTQLGERTGRQYIEASGEGYSERDLTDLGKGYKNLGAVSDVFAEVNRKRVEAGQRALPLNVLKRAVDTGVGANSFINGFNDVDDKAITQALGVMGEQYDLAAKGRDFYEQLSGNVEGRAGPKFELSQQIVDKEWNRMFPKKVPRPAARQTGPAPGYTYDSRLDRGGTD